jgi:hypothetical protein
MENNHDKKDNERENPNILEIKITNYLIIWNILKKI